MPTVPCPACTQPISLPDPPTAAAYSCPHCKHRIPSGVPKRTPSPKPESFDFDDDDDDDDTPPAKVRPTRRRRGRNPIADFFVFRLMVTPLIIQIVFWVGVLVCWGIAARVIVEALNTDGPGKRQVSIDMLAAGVLIAFAGPLLVRVYCELSIIFFRIHDELKAANDRHQYRK